MSVTKIKLRRSNTVDLVGTRQSRRLTLTIFSNFMISTKKNKVLSGRISGLQSFFLDVTEGPAMNVGRLVESNRTGNILWDRKLYSLRPIILWPIFGHTRYTWGLNSNGNMPTHLNTNVLVVVNSRCNRPNLKPNRFNFNSGFTPVVH